MMIPHHVRLSIFIFGSIIFLSSLSFFRYWVKQSFVLEYSSRMKASVFEAKASSLGDGKQQQQEQRQRRQKFPRWEKSGIDIHHLTEYTQRVLNNTLDGHHIPTSVYIIDSNWTLWASNKLRRQYKKIAKRYSPSERMASSSLRYLKKLIKNNETHPWRPLERAIQNGGFPFLAYYKDFVGCNEKNWKRSQSLPKVSIPIFTLSARLDCNYAFPWPTYEFIGLSKSHAREWHSAMLNNSEMFIQKRPKAVWRGSLTGTNNKQLKDSHRWRLCEAAANDSYNLIDAKLVQIPDWRTDANLSVVGGGLAPKMNMHDFQSYAAVIDVDGNSWSSRFAALLCMDSVVLKVQPTSVDYFYDQLEPWTHYIPINETLHDLISQVEWVLTNPKQVRNIVEKAHEWCSQRVVKGAIIQDILSIWNEYVQYLDAGDPAWTMVWQKGLDNVFQPQNEMKRVS